MFEQKKFEYAHHVLFPEIHFGKHSVFGDHLALGTGRNSIHIYKGRIFMGDAGEVRLTPAQSRIVFSFFHRLEQKIGERSLLEKIEVKDADPGHLPDVPDQR